MAEGTLNAATGQYRDDEITVRPFINRTDFPGWPGYVVERRYWYIDRHGEKDERVDLIKWVSTYAEADALRVKIRDGL